MKTILVPTDLPDNAAHALRSAVALATLTGSKLVLVHVLPIQVIATAESAVYASQEPLLQEFYTGKLYDLARQIQLENDFQFKVETYCEHGPFHDIINEMIFRLQVDLVVMGSKSANTLLDNLIGSKTLSFMKVAQCPVLVVPAAAHLFGLKKIAYASDFAGDERVFLQQLFTFAAPFKAEVYVVHVITPGHARSSGAGLLEDMIREFPDQKFCVAQIKANTIAAGIRAFVKENSINVLAVSIHERGMLEDLFHRSVSKKLATETLVPLLALPERPYNLPQTQPQESESIAK
ncbi:universal stress protein [Pontibacter chitinilyticus]|uniref:universal stress protein n=1 Tax=Pontibacter chitinilyticus TaxID=2674989 RepID=UPI003219B88C